MGARVLGLDERGLRLRLRVGLRPRASGEDVEIADVGLGACVEGGVWGREWGYEYDD